jgi:hypothetical protein
MIFLFLSSNTASVRFYVLFQQQKGHERQAGERSQERVSACFHQGMLSMAKETYKKYPETYNSTRGLVI